MRRSGRLFIVIGVALALAAAALAAFALSGGDSQADEKTTKSNEPVDVTVVQAKKDISAHTLVTADDVEEITVSSDAVSDDAVRSVGEVIGFSYNTDLVSGQRLVRTNLEQPGLGNELEPGMRAVSIPVDQNNLIGGLLREDDVIDLVWTMPIELTRVNPTEPLEMTDNLTLGDVAVVLPPYGESPGPTYPFPGEAGSRFLISDTNGGDPQAKLLLQNVRVMRVVAPGIDAGESTDDNFIVVEVTPQEAELITYMINYGSIQVALRGEADTEQTATSGINLEQMVNQWAFPYPKTVRVPGPGAQ